MTHPDSECPVVDDVVRGEAEYGEVSVGTGCTQEVGGLGELEVFPAPGEVVTREHFIITIKME